jgi:hypothetical protein
MLYEYDHCITIGTTQGVLYELCFIELWAGGLGEPESPYLVHVCVESRLRSVLWCDVRDRDMWA